METLNCIAVHNFCQYLQIETVHPNPDYSKAVEFLKDQAQQLQLEFDVVELVADNPIVILKWNGANKTLKSVVLSSHMDVVPVFVNKWDYHPFSAHIDEDGNIFARGSQDMKCVGSQYLEAIRRIKTRSPSYIPERDIYILFVPDEELGGKRGLKMFVETDHFKLMNMGIFMDEGIASPSEEYLVFYGQRTAMWLAVMIFGDNKKGLDFFGNSIGKTLNTILTKFMDFRNAEEARMIEEDLKLGDVTTLNLTGMSGGLEHNMFPDKFTLNFDIRITPLMDLVKFRNMLEEWAVEAGGSIEYKIVSQTDPSPLTSIDSSNPWWASFEAVCNSMGMKIIPQIFPASTDGRFVRIKGISAIGFSPMNMTPVLLHDHNEFLNTNTFIRGIDFYEKLIPSLAAVVDL